jgi:hypothetical protein
MHAITRILAAGLCAATAASAVYAQGQMRAGKPAPAPSAAARSAQAAPNPAGLRPVVPAGISSGSGAAVSGDPVTAGASPVAPGGQPPVTGNDGSVVGGGGIGVPSELPPNGGVAPNTSVLGAGGVVAGPGQYPGGLGSSTMSAADEARLFFFADANKDGELSRAEAGRLGGVGMSFEQMDRNFDGIISRFEYQDAVR